MIKSRRAFLEIDKIVIIGILILFLFVMLFAYGVYNNKSLSIIKYLFGAS